MQRQSNTLIGLPALALALAAACSPIKTSTGYLPDEELVAKVRAGVHDKDSISELLGSPTTVADFNGETWFYVSRKSEYLAFFDEKVTEQKVVAIRFNDAGIVDGVKRYELDDGKPVEPVERVTPTRGKELTVLEQLFGNIGRFTNQNQP